MVTLLNNRSAVSIYLAGTAHIKLDVLPCA